MKLLKNRKKDKKKDKKRSSSSSSNPRGQKKARGSYSTVPFTPAGPPRLPSEQLTQPGDCEPAAPDKDSVKESDDSDLSDSSSSSSS